MRTAKGAVVLLGDSVLDNAAYAGGDPDVVTCLRALLPRGLDARLLAIDGSTCRDLASQLDALPAEATGLVVSIGGNDALEHLDLLNAPVTSTAEALLAFDSRLTGFETDLREACRALHARNLPTLLCTIYEAAFEDPTTRRLARTALRIFQDVLLRTAFEFGFDVLDLRRVCTEPGDYVLEIEPSGRGGAKIAKAIANAIVTQPGAACSVVHPP
jgi:hypothetical protein